MIKRKRKPRTEDEQMILNNYEAMNYMRDNLVEKELELEDLLYLQTVLTKNTLKNDKDS
ncbi:MAG: hypothetical protein LBQ59_02095 [Candidatus Peribacteria bacterium]|jgi:hypothetical protein|nr:hypothetical protein [Candidatus Peribacteria bacterium]